MSAMASSAEGTSLLISWRSGVVVMVRIEAVDMGCIISQGVIVEHRRAPVYLICAEGHSEAYAKRAKRGHV